MPYLAKAPVLPANALPTSLVAASRLIFLARARSCAVARIFCCALYFFEKALATSNAARVSESVKASFCPATISSFVRLVASSVVKPRALSVAISFCCSASSAMAAAIAVLANFVASPKAAVIAEAASAAPAAMLLNTAPPVLPRLPICFPMPRITPLAASLATMANTAVLCALAIRTSPAFQSSQKIHQRLCPYQQVARRA